MIDAVSSTNKIRFNTPLDGACEAEDGDPGSVLSACDVKLETLWILSRDVSGEIGVGMFEKDRILEVGSFEVTTITASVVVAEA